MTTTHRKAHPPSKFNFDRNSLRTLEISGPIQIPPPATGIPPFHASTMPHRTINANIDQSSVCQPLVSSIPQNAENPNKETNKLIPVRPAPSRPNCPPQRTPSWATPPAVSPSVTRTASLRGPCDKKDVSRPLSSASFRPSCPPPRPPPPRIESPTRQETCMYEDINKPLGENDRSDTPCSTYYDDCQTLDFSDTPLSFVHKQAQAKRDNKPSEIHYKPNFSGQHQPGCLVNKSDSRTLNVKNQKPPGKPVIPQPARSAPNTVQALAKKFEKDSCPNKDYIPDISMRPPFKSRPLPPRPANTDV